MALQIDPTIVLLVQKYLENNKDKTFVDISQMAEDIQKQHREYAYRKRSTFRSEVKDAYQVVLKSYTKGKNDSSDEDLVSDGSDDESDKSSYVSNNLRNQLKDSLNTLNPRMVESVLIDISSEDSEEEAIQNSKQSNGSVCNPAQFKSNVITLQPIYNNKPSLQNPTVQERAKKRKSEATISPVKEGASKTKRRYLGSDTTSSEQQQKFVGCSFDHIGGYDKVIDEIGKSIAHLNSAEIEVNMPKISGILIYGPSGSGKTLLVNAIATELDFNLVQISAEELLIGVAKQNEDKLREVFDKTLNLSGCVLCIDKIDALDRKKTNENENIISIISHIINGFDLINSSPIRNKVIIIGTATDLNDVHPSLRRVKRFEKQIGLNVPNEKEREAILTILTKDLNMEKDLSLSRIAKETRGFVGSDLELLVAKAYFKAMDRLLVIKIPESNNKEENVQLVQQEELVEKNDENSVNNKLEDTATANITEPNLIVDDVNVDEKKAENTLPSGDAVLVLDDTEESQKDHSIAAPTSVYPNQTNGEIIVDRVTSESTVINEVLVSQQAASEIQTQSPRRWTDIKHLLSTEILKTICVQIEDFLEALKSTYSAIEDQHSFILTPNSTYEDIGALKNIKEELITEISLRVKCSDKFRDNGLKIANHILLCGPPGCGKTMLINGLANEICLNFIWQKSYVLQRTSLVEKEKAIRECFNRARSSNPCILFLSDLELFCPKKCERDEDRVMDQILLEIDKIKPEDPLFILASTNDPNSVNSRILDRFGKIIYVGLPSREARIDILRTITKNGSKPKLDDDLDLVSLGTSEQLEGYTGQDLVRLVNRAYNLAIKESINADTNEVLNPIIINRKHFVNAIDKMMPSITENEQKKYDIMKRVYSSGPDNADTEEMEYS